MEGLNMWVRVAIILDNLEAGCAANGCEEVDRQRCVD